MNNKWSKFGNRFTRHTGARELMDDLGIAMNTKRNICMLGGGNPAHINEIENLFRDELRNLIDSDSEYRRMLGNYSMPAGEERFRTSLAELLHREYGLERLTQYRCCQMYLYRFDNRYRFFSIFFSR